MKAKRCRVCRENFQPSNSLQIACRAKCALKYARDQVRKKEAKDLRERKRAIKSRQDWLREAQVEFNKYIRARDADKTCISCGRYHRGQYHAGHYRTVGACPELRFNELNCHKQCAPCNNHLSGNIVEYRINLVRRIGQEAVEFLEGPHGATNYTIDDLKEIKQAYRKKAKQLMEKAT